MVAIALTLPYPPSVNGYWRAVNGRQIISKRGREYRRAVVDAVALLPIDSPVSGSLAVTIWASMPDKRRRDLDNLLKSSLDALGHAGVYEDDSQIDDLRVVREGIDRDFPRLDIRIERLGGDV